MGKRRHRFEHHAGVVIDRELDDAQQSKLRRVRRGVRVNSTGFSVTVPRGDGYEVAELFEQTADVYLYFNDAGPRRVTFRIPASALSLEAVQRHLVGDEYGGLTAKADGDDLLVRFAIFGEDNELFNMGEDGEGWLPLIEPVRAELMSGQLDVLELGELLEDWCHRTKGEPDLPADYGLSKASRILAAYMLLEPNALDAWAYNRGVE